MKKIGLMITLLTVLVFSFGAVSAKTLIAGKIYNHDYSKTVAGADVSVNCNSNIRNTTSLGDGSYAAVYNEIDCDVNDSLNVYAFHPSYGFGNETGIINKDVFNNSTPWNLGLVNVPLVPEFGLIVGALTILSAAGIFFFVRRN
jgi:hypothetical protein